GIDRAGINRMIGPLMAMGVSLRPIGRHVVHSLVGMTVAEGLDDIAMAADTNRLAVDGLAAYAAGSGAVQVAVDRLAAHGLGMSRQAAPDDRDGGESEGTRTAGHDILLSGRSGSKAAGWQWNWRRRHSCNHA